MATLTSKQELIDYVLRNLGGGVINLEVTPEQLSDRIDDTIQFFTERHYLGVDEAFLYHALSYSDLQNGFTKIPEDFVAITEVFSPTEDANRLNDSGIAAWDSLEWQMEDLYWGNIGAQNSVDFASYYIMKEHYSTMRTLLEDRKRFTHNKLSSKFVPHGWSFYDIKRFNKVTDPLDLTKDTWTPLTDTVVTKNNGETPDGSNILTSIGGTSLSVIGVSQEMDLKQYYNKKEFSGKISLQSSGYTGLVDIIIKDENSNVISTTSITLSPQLSDHYFKFEVLKSHGSKLSITIQSQSAIGDVADTFFYNGLSIWKNPYLVLKGYKSLDTSVDVNIFNDRWIKEYATAVIGMQHGRNVSKFAGVNLPGGVQIDGDKIYDRYKMDYDKLVEDFTSYFELPIDMVVA